MKAPIDDLKHWLSEISGMTTSQRAGTAMPVSQKSLLARNIQRLLTLDEQLGEIDNAAVYVQSNEIRWVGTTADIPAEFHAADQIIDLSMRVVMPGMVNTHHHMVRCMPRCLNADWTALSLCCCCTSGVKSYCCCNTTGAMPHKMRRPGDHAQGALGCDGSASAHALGACTSNGTRPRAILMIFSSSHLS